MTTKKKAVIAAIITILFVLVLDQVVKILVKTNMTLGESINVFGSWFQICFTENPGFAFGMELGGSWGKLFLTLFRIVAVVGIAWILIKIIRENYPTAFVVGIAMLFAGAVGNIIDSVFYGVIFNDSYGGVATLFPAGGGYAPLLHGRVVDMLYFPIISGHFPSWSPVWANQEFIFFRPIFNIADSAITVSIIYLLLFQRKSLSQILK